MLDIREGEKGGIFFSFRLIKNEWLRVALLQKFTMSVKMLRIYKYLMLFYECIIEKDMVRKDSWAPLDKAVKGRYSVLWKDT